jgi:DNA-binding response OmpR family regulator
LPTVLIVEDEPLVMQTVSAALRLKGYNVMQVVTAAGAVQYALGQPHGVDLLVADVLLPRQSGVQAAIEIWQTWPEIAVLFISGTPLEGWQARDLQSLQVLPRGTWDFLQKPFRASALEHRVRELLGRSASSHSAS